MRLLPSEGEFIGWIGSGYIEFLKEGSWVPLYIYMVSYLFDSLFLLRISYKF